MKVYNCAMHSSRIMGFLLAGLSVLVLIVWWTTWLEYRGGLLTVSFLNIGQGDATFITSPTGNQVLIDGGPANGGVIRRLGEVMPWYDHSIDVVIGTHPDADHIGGLPDVLDRYRVDYFMQSSAYGSTPTWSQFEDAVRSAQKRSTHVVTALRGQVLDIGGGAYLEILSPDRALPFVDTNTACVVVRLVYGNTAFML